MSNCKVVYVEEDSEVDGYVTPPSQIIRVSLEKPPKPPRKRSRKYSEVFQKQVLNTTLHEEHPRLPFSVKSTHSSEEDRYNTVLREYFTGSRGKCSFCGDITKLRPGKTVCFRLNCALGVSSTVEKPDIKKFHQGKRAGELM